MSTPTPDGPEQFLFPWGEPQAAAPDHSVRGHHPFGPSKLNAYAACPGYRPREGGASEAADEGTALHEWMERVAAHAVDKHLEFIPALDALVRGETLDHEHYGYLRTCCEQVDVFLRKVNRAFVRFHNEIQVTVRRPDGSVVNYGHLDLLLTWDGGRKGVLLDYKFGWLPVPPAAENLQGVNYALGVLQQFPDLKFVGVMFIQPKIRQVSMAMFGRDDMDDMLGRIDGVIAEAQNPAATLRPNPYCDYCERAGTCAALASSAHAALTKYEELPFPAAFGQVEIKTPQDAAKALYVIGRLETHFTAAKSALRQLVLEATRDTGGRLEVSLPGGEKIVVESRQRNAPRSLGDPLAVAQALGEVLTTQQVLSCSELSLTKLETLFADMMVLRGNERSARMMDEAQQQAEADPARAGAVLEAAQAAAKDLRVTKKWAKEAFASVLAEEGLLTSGEGKVDYLKVRLEKGQALLTP